VTTDTARGAGEHLAAADPGVVLRRMRWWDIDDLLPLEQQLFADDPPWTAELFWAELAGVPSRRAYLVAVEGGGEGVVVGYGGVALGADGCDVQTLAVHPGRRRGGVGSRLLAALTERAAQVCPGAWQWCEVRADNAGALAFYQRHGFDRVARRPAYYARGADGRPVAAVVLRRRLPGPA
jgi:ribosomal-protein-alanine N-acetyltransferase